MPDTQIPDDLVGAFQIEGEPVRGRVARLGPAIDQILLGHDYPAPWPRWWART
jgi:molecular chaperone Hsp33